MARANRKISPITAAKRVRDPLNRSREEFQALGIKTLGFGRWWIRYEGSRQSVIDSGLALPTQIPGHPPCRKSSVFRFATTDGREWRVSLSPKRQIIRVLVRLADEEVALPEHSTPSTLGSGSRQSKLAKPKLPAPEPEADGEKPWPPDLAGNPEILVGDGTRWHYLATADAFMRADFLDEDELPGTSTCKRRWHYFGWRGGQAFTAARLGKHVAVTLWAKNAGIGFCRPAQSR